jgi:hypothetical protein
VVYYTRWSPLSPRSVAHHWRASASSSPASPAWSPARWRPTRAAGTVYGAARFAGPAQREAHEAAGVTTIRLDLEHGEHDEVPADLDYVLHFAVAKTNDFGRDLAINADGAANLMEKVQGVEAFFHCSSGGVYQSTSDYLGRGAARRQPPRCGDKAYSISKTARRWQYTAKRPGSRPSSRASACRTATPSAGLFFHVMMLEHGMAIPVHTDAPSQYNPLNLDDIVAPLPLPPDVGIDTGERRELGWRRDRQRRGVVQSDR